MSKKNEKITTVRDAIAADEEQQKPVRAKKPFGRNAKVIITNPAHELAARFATVFRCKGYMHKLYDRETRTYSKERRFNVELHVDGVADTMKMPAESVRLADGFMMDDIRDLVETLVKQKATHHVLTHDHYISRMDGQLTKMRDDLIRIEAAKETSTEPVEIEIEDERMRISYGWGAPSEWSHAPITVHRDISRYDSRCEISFSSFTATPGQLLGYARQLEAAAHRAIALQNEAIAKIEELRAEEVAKRENVANYVADMQKQFDEI